MSATSSRRSLTALLLFVLTTRAEAQPLAWLLELHGYWNDGTDRLLVVNGASGAPVASFEAPAGVDFGASGAVTPDGRYYLLATSAGIARYHTTPPAFDRLIGPVAEIERVTVAPTGTRVHAVGPGGRAVVDWETGAVLHRECCDQLVVDFTPDGLVRIERRLRQTPTGTARTVSAIRASTDAVLWDIQLDVFLACGPGAASRVYFAYYCGDWSETSDVFIWNISTGTEARRLFTAGPVAGLAWSGDRLLLSHLHGSSETPRLSAYDPATDVLTTIAERNEGLPASEPGLLVLSPDERVAYWQTRHHRPQFGSLVSLYDVIDLRSGSRAGTGRLPGFQQHLAISLSRPCQMQVPGAVSVPAEGGVVEIPVMPVAPCHTWAVPG